MNIYMMIKRDQTRSKEIKNISEHRNKRYLLFKYIFYIIFVHVYMQNYYRLQSKKQFFKFTSFYFKI